MIDKTEWEVVDDSSPHQQNRQQQHAHAPRNAAQAAGVLLGPWWKWKLAGIATVALMVFALAIAVIGVAALAVAALAITVACARKLMRWMRGGRRDVTRWPM